MLPSGPQILDGVSAIFDGAATGAIHPHDVGSVIGGSLLQDIQGKVFSELTSGPGGGPYTKVLLGKTTPAPSPLTTGSPPFLPHFQPRVDIQSRGDIQPRDDLQPRVDITPKSKPVKNPNHGPSYHDGYAIGTSDNPKTKEKPKPVSKKGPEPSGQLSFSELMSDFLQKPLPIKASQKKNKTSDNRPGG